MKTPKASFVVPCYNSTDTLAETINSCIVQNERNIEIVCVDDGSTDSTQKLFDYFRSIEPRFVGVKLEKNAGRSNARNVGISTARGDVLFMLDSDDIAMSNRVSETLKYLKKNPTVDIVYSDFQISNYAGKIEDVYVKSEAFNPQALKKEGFTYIGHSTMAFRKKVAEKIKYDGGDFCRMGFEDWKFQVDAHKAGFRFGNINKPLAIYRMIPKERDEKKIKEIKDKCLADL